MHKRYVLLSAAIIAVIAIGFIFNGKDRSPGKVDVAQFDKQLGELVSDVVSTSEESDREWDKADQLEAAIAAGRKNLAQLSKIAALQVSMSIPHNDTNATAYYNAVREFVQLEVGRERDSLSKLESLQTNDEFKAKKSQIREANDRHRSRLRELVKQSQMNFARTHRLQLVATNKPQQ